MNLAPLRSPQIGTISSVNALTGVSGVYAGSHGFVDCTGYTNLVLYVKASAALSDGTITIYETDENGAMTAVNALGTIALETPFASTGGSYAYHLPQAAYGLVQAVITEAVVGGTITAVLRAS